MTGQVLFCFDGSDGSRRALTAGAAQLRVRPAVVLTVWQTIDAQLLPYGGRLAVATDETDTDVAAELEAREAALRGAAIAASHGWQATTRVEQAPITVWQTVVEVADEVDAAVIVCGTRGLNAAKRALLGSVSDGVLRHCRRPALIVPVSHLEAAAR